MSTVILALSGIVAVFVIIGIFLICRSIVLWYFCITQMLENQKEVIRLLVIIADKVAPLEDEETPTPQRNPLTRQ